MSNVADVIPQCCGHIIIGHVAHRCRRVATTPSGHCTTCAVERGLPLQPDDERASRLKAIVDAARRLLLKRKP